MTVIRPNLPPAGAPQPQAPRLDEARLAAQRAFFGAAAAPASTAQPAPAQAAAPVQKIPAEAPAEPPRKILRPGSLLDIRV